MKKCIALILVAVMLLCSGILSIADEQPEEAVAPAVTETEEIPAEEVPAEEIPAEEIPAEEILAEEIPAEETPVEEIPAEEQPAEEIPAEEQPAEEQPAEETPDEEVPAEEAPAEEVPAEEIPEETEETEEDPMAVIEVPEELEEEFTGTISVSLHYEGEELYYGDTVTLRATVKNANRAYSIRWEANAGSEWYRIGSGNSYSFVVNEQNAVLAYRAVLVVD